MRIAGTVVLEVGSEIVVVVLVVGVGLLVLVVGAGLPVLVTSRTVVVGSKPAPDVLTRGAGVPDRELGAADVGGLPVVAAPEPPGNVGPDELAAASE